MGFHIGHKGQLSAADTRSCSQQEIPGAPLQPSLLLLLTSGTRKALQHLQLRFSQTLAPKPGLICLSVGASRDSRPEVQSSRSGRPAPVPRSPPAQQDSAKPGRSAASTAGTRPGPSHGAPETPEHEEWVGLLVASFSDIPGRARGGCKSRGSAPVPKPSAGQCQIPPSAL